MIRFVLSACLLGFIFPMANAVHAQSPTRDSLLRVATKTTGLKQAVLFAQIAIQYRNTDGDSAMHYARMAYDRIINTRDEAAKMLAASAMGHAYSVKGLYHSSLPYFNQSLEIALQSGNDSAAASAYTGTGNCYWHLGKHAEALDRHFKALRLRESVGDNSGIATSKVNIGMVYQSQEKVELSEQYIREALDQMDDSYPPLVRLSAMHTLANLYGMQGKIGDALRLDSTGIALCEKTGNNFSKAMFYDNMGNCYLYGDPPDYEKSIGYFQRTIAIDSSFGNKKQMSDSYLNLGMVYVTQKKYEDAIPYLHHSIELARASGYAQGQQLGYKFLAESYRKAGNSEQAFVALQEAGRIKDSLLTVKSESVIAELQTVYETEKKEKQIELQQTQLSKKNFILAATVLFSLLAAFSAYLYYRRYRLRQQHALQSAVMKQQELATRAVLEAEERERQRIARDLHDGVGQMMSAAKMNLSAFESELGIRDPEQRHNLEKIIALVDESCTEVRAVSHNMMPNALLKKSLSSAIREFIDKLNTHIIKVQLHTEGLDEKIDTAVETVLYRVIQECVNNVVKHAEANHLDISVIRDEDGISATIEDNGKGFDTRDMDKAAGIGLRNIQTRIGYLKGTVDFDSSPGKGTLVAIHVPLQTSKMENANDE